jgi:hypothetical protein
MLVAETEMSEAEIAGHNLGWPPVATRTWPPAPGQGHK